MDFFRRYSPILGFFVLACVAAILLSTPEAIFSKGVSFVDTELDRSSGNEVFVRTKLDFGNKEHLKTFPLQIDGWQGHEYETTKIEKELKADVILLRAYDHPKYYLPVYFLTMQSSTTSSFHPPPICYRALGYRIEEEGSEQVLVSEVDWAEQSGNPSGWHVPFKKLVVYKKSDGEVIERRVVLYCYVKPNRFTSDEVTMIRFSALAPVDGSYDGAFKIVKDFAAQAIPYMFELSEERGEGEPIIFRLAAAGPGGYFIILLLFSIPLAIFIIPRIRRSGS